MYLHICILPRIKGLPVSLGQRLKLCSSRRDCGLPGRASGSLHPAPSGRDSPWAPLSNTQCQGALAKECRSPLLQKAAFVPQHPASGVEEGAWKAPHLLWVRHTGKQFLGKESSGIRICGNRVQKGCHPMFKGL